MTWKEMTDEIVRVADDFIRRNIFARRAHAAVPAALAYSSVWFNASVQM